jgi:hypothetical protein
MNLSDLLHARVIDATGADIGAVDDVRLVQSGPVLLPFGAAFRVVGLAIGHRAVERRLGYQLGGVRNPWLVRTILGALGKTSRYVEWKDVVTWTGEEIHITKRRDELPPLHAAR